MNMKLTALKQSERQALECTNPNCGSTTHFEEPKEIRRENGPTGEMYIKVRCALCGDMSEYALADVIHLSVDSA